MVMTARQMIKKAYSGHKNFMTPNIIRYGKISNNIAYELSEGEGFSHNTMIYGVTVVSETEGKVAPEYELSQSFDNRESAEQYIKELKESKRQGL